MGRELIKLAILFETFVQLTQPGGGKVWIEESHISTIRPHLGHCAGNTTIVTDSGTFCVMETMDEIRAILQTKPLEPGEH